MILCLIKQLYQFKLTRHPFRKSFQFKNEKKYLFKTYQLKLKNIRCKFLTTILVFSILFRTQISWNKHHIIYYQFCFILRYSVTITLYYLFSILFLTQIFCNKHHIICFQFCFRLRYSVTNIILSIFNSVSDSDIM